MTEILPIPIERWMAHHRKRKVILRGADGRLINWPWCLFMWDKLGRPVVYAAPGDPFYDLSLYFYPEKISPRQLQGIATWLEEHSGKVARKSPQVTVPIGQFTDPLFEQKGKEEAKNE